MLNKKTIFNFVYAMALVGAVLSCVGILNEFLNIAQLHGGYIDTAATMTGDSYTVPFSFYLVAFIVSALALTLLLLRLFVGQKSFDVAVNLLVLAACIVLIVLSFVLVDKLKRGTSSSLYDYWISYFDYLIYYTFRTGIMSFVANTGVILVCNLLDAKHQKAQDDVPIEE